MDKEVKKHKRWTAKRKFELVLDMLQQGASLDELSRCSCQPAHALSQWRDDFLSRGELLFKEPETPHEKALSEEVVRLKAKIGDITIDNDLLYEKIKLLENGIPFHLRKLKT